MPTRRLLTWLIPLQMDYVLGYRSHQDSNEWEITWIVPPSVQWNRTSSIAQAALALLRRGLIRISQFLSKPLTWASCQIHQCGIANSLSFISGPYLSTDPAIKGWSCMPSTISRMVGFMAPEPGKSFLMEKSCMWAITMSRELALFNSANKKITNPIIAFSTAR